MVEVDPIKQIRNFKELKQIDAYRKWHKKIPKELTVELDEKERELFCLSMNAETPLKNSFWKQVWHYEQFLTAKNMKKTYARYTRRAVEELDVKRFLENLVRKPETLGFKHLEEFDSLDISYEQVILEHADIIEAVNKRLSKQD